MGVLDFLKNFIYNKATDDQGLSGLWGKKKQQEQPQVTVPTQSAQSADGEFLPPPDYVPTIQIPDETPVTEGPGTKLIQQEDGTVIRVPTDQELPGSTTIQVDDQPPVGEVDYDAIPKETPVLEKVDKVLSREEAKANWLHKTRNSPAQRSGAWDSEQGREDLWQTHLNNQAWRRDKGRSYIHGDYLPESTTEKADDFIKKVTQPTTEEEKVPQNPIELMGI